MSWTGEFRPTPVEQVMYPPIETGTLPHDSLMICIELFGTKVAPRVREMLE